MKSGRTIAVLHSPEDVAGSLPDLTAEMGVDLELHYITDPLPAVETIERLFVLGSAESAYDDQLPWIKREMEWLTQVQRRGIPTLGICFGSQILARVLGGSVVRNDRAEIGWTPMSLHTDDWQHQGPWLNFHFDRFVPPADAELLAETELAPQAFRMGKTLGVQFHPEITVAMFDTWIDYWNNTEEGRTFLASAGDLPQRMREEIAANEADNRTRCRRLVSDFFAIA